MKGILSFLFCFLLLIMSVRAAAAEQPVITDIPNWEEIQRVVDEINEEYGTSFRIPTREELESAGLVNDFEISAVDRETLEIFREQLREAAIAEGKTSKFKTESSPANNSGTLWIGAGIAAVAAGAIIFLKFRRKKVT